MKHPHHHDHCTDGGTVATIPDDAPTVALIGSPNAGKTTVFNSLTGIHAKTANYPGVTVTRREGSVDIDGRHVRLVDLPGTYSLTPVSPDEEIVIEALEGHVAGVAAPDGLAVVVDATTLERSLFLVSEVLALDRPTLVVLTMVDEVAARGGAVDIERLSAALGVPVLAVVGHRGIGLDELRRLLAEPERWSRPVMAPPDDPAERADWVESIVRSTVTAPGPDHRSTRIDNVLLHPVWGSVVFLAAMVVFFQVIFAFAAPLMDLVDRGFGSLIDAVHRAVPGMVGDFLADGVIGGVGGVLVFLPQITLLFVLLALMEKCGYLARAALLADRVMGVFGLEGRSFVSMLSSFACAVPGIMSTRTIPDQRTRISTMLAAPLMTCSARLPVYTLLVSAFVPDRSVLGPLRSQGLVMFGLYLLGAVSGLVYAGVLHLTTRRGASASFVMELPPYRWPTWRGVAIQTWEGAGGFVRKAGTIILATSMALWVLLNVPQVDAPSGLPPAAAASYEMEHSIAGYAGQALEPVTAPLGFEWRTNVALIGSLAAREVFVSTISITTAAQDEDSVGDRMASITDDSGDPIYDGPTVAALLIFFVYALQCFPTIAVLRRETNSWRWPAIAFGSMLVLAYVGALVARTFTQVVS